ncbi:RNA polymerase sigma factor [Hymenobacter sp. BT186]|uniref:RNA polymerase sigma factor n=1 Tax=Hymenobacter telluris TaxID=2816474 RepID=A0A939EV77_9BACT|nr:RNA polymerase sigma factor [Hymenobacter telluris]MBO0357275.1 RNA polymerase sigma factor [Hymenobacter telluris]MBW3373301.1 RNA polymerase sigma factor [Hymenobacter norwichensis]
MASPELDSALLTNILAGCQRLEQASQRRLYMLYYSYGLSVCLRYLHDRDVALEVVNDGFMKIFQDVARFDTGLHADLAGSLRGWIRKVMVHTAIDRFRANSRHTFQTDLDSVPNSHADSSHSPLDALSFEELLHLIGQLTPAYRAVFNMYVVDGYTHEEIATQLGISVGASKSNLFKAREHLKTLLKKNKHHAYARYVG